jgi:hypothetical protein
VTGDGSCGSGDVGAACDWDSRPERRGFLEASLSSAPPYMFIVSLARFMSQAMKAAIYQSSLQLTLLLSWSHLCRQKFLPMERDSPVNYNSRSFSQKLKILSSMVMIEKSSPGKGFRQRKPPNYWTK